MMALRVFLACLMMLNLLDLTISSDRSANIIWHTVEDQRGSDHFLISLLSTHILQPSQGIPKWKLEHANWNEYQCRLHAILDPKMNYSLEQFSDLISNVAITCIPRTSGRTVVGKRVPWWNDEVASAVKKRCKALRALRKLDVNDHRVSEVLKLFRSERNKTRYVIAKAKEVSWTDFVEGINQNSTTSDIWRRVGLLQGRYRIPRFHIKINDNYTDNPQLVAEELADQYSSVSNFHRTTSSSSSLENSNIIVSQAKTAAQNEENVKHNHDFTLSELNWALGKCISKGTGLDGIGYPLLKNLPNSGKISLLATLNSVWQTGNIPST